MDKRIVWGIVGVAVVVAVIWLTTRPGDIEAVPGQESLASASRSAPPAPMPDAAAPTSGSAASEPVVPAGTQPAATPQVAAAAEALPIDVSPGFEYLGKPASEMKDTDARWSHWRRHQQLQSEPRDVAWSPRVETSLRGVIEESLTSRGLDTRRIEISALECRTSGCEIQAVGYMEDNRKPGVDLQLIMFEMFRGNLGNEFDRDQFTMSLQSREDQRVNFLVFLPRKNP